MEITLPHNYTPREYQIPFLASMDGGIKRAVLVWHRRAGKDKTVLNYVIKQMTQRVGAYYYFFPTYAQGKKVLWDGRDKEGFKFLDHIPPEIRKSAHINEMKVEIFNGSYLQIIGTDNYDAIVGTNPVGCVFSEFSIQDPIVWDLVRPILAENGGFAIFIFTPRGKNHGHGLYEMAKQNPSWYCSKLTVKDTGALPLAVIQEEKEAGMSEEMIEQEYFCSFEGSSEGSYLGSYMRDLEANNHITRGLYDPTLPVSTWWDIGMNDSMTILFSQVLNKEIRWVDYYESSGEGLEFYTKKLASLPYTYESHNMPHDSAAREIGTGKSIKDVGESLGLRNVNIIPAPERKEFGIQAVRSILPKVYIDQDKCARLIDGLKNYSKKWDDERKVWKNEPLHDWSSHIFDAAQTFALGYKESIAQTQKKFTIKYDSFGRPEIKV